MEELDLKKCVKEVEEFRLLPPVAIEIPLLAAMEIISYVQLATRNPLLADSEFGKMAIDVARQLQNSFDPNSESYKLLELGWEFQADLRQVQRLRERVLHIFETDIDTAKANLLTSESGFATEPGPSDQM
jgi:hypothetical protein